MTSMIEIGQAGQQLCRQTQGGGKACAPIDATRVKHMLLKDAQLVPNDTAYAVQADEDADFCGLNKFDVVAKANCAVVMATQSLSDATRSGLLDVLLESCPFRFFGANPAAMTDGEEGEPGPRQFYQKFGLTDAQIELIRHATPKRHYLIDCPDGSALIDLRLGRTA